MASTKKEKNQQIQVFVRVRPPNTQEKDARSPTVVEVPNNREITVKQHSTMKKFTFDQSFGPKSSQLEVYTAVVSPLIDEVLAGYNCTVFAYGQTGTGKTHTMIGSNHHLSNVSWQNDPQSGIIPRTLSQLFDELRLLQVEYTVRVSYLELYNEELFDLLSPTDDSSKIRLYEDSVKKGSVIVHGLEEVIVHNKSEVYKILEKGSEKRQTAATLMNAQSSRSHTVFSITVHTKDSSLEGEDLLKTGKLNLVDLAGSENIGRSGAVDKRAREAGNINQSLLTLGRVITSLVERAPHIPYRESKLTRLLQDSLGGRTKTSIIATVSPAICNLEETMSTLDYAHRAKNITNRPEINQRFTKTALLKQYTEEIEKLRRDLIASRACNGIYLAPENYTAMLNEIENYATELSEKINEHRAVSDELEKSSEICKQLKIQLLNTDMKLKETETRLKTTTEKSIENEHLLEKYSETETTLSTQAKTLLASADASARDVYKLHATLATKKANETHNLKTSQAFQRKFNANLIKMQEHCEQFVTGETETTGDLLTKITNTVTTNRAELLYIYGKVVQSIKNQNVLIDSLKKQITSQHEINDTNASQLKESISNELAVLSETLQAHAVPKLEKLIDQSEENARSLLKLQERLTELLTKNMSHNKQFVDTSEQGLFALRDSTNKVSNQMNQQFAMIERNQEEGQKNQRELLEFIQKFIENHNRQINEMSSFKNEAVKSAKDTEHTISEQFDNQIQLGVSFVTTCQNDLVKDTEIITKSFAEHIDNNEARIKACRAIITDEQVRAEKVRENTLSSSDTLHATVNECSTKIRNICNAASEITTTTEDALSVAGQLTDEYHDYATSCPLKYTQTLASEFSEQQRTQRAFEEYLTGEIHTRNSEIQKLFTEDMILAAKPTGETPIKREYQFPRFLAATSPRERIIKRFWNAQRKNNKRHDDDEHRMNSFDSPSLVQSNETNDDGEHMNRVLVKSASVNDIRKSPTTDQSPDQNVLTKKPSNKENGISKLDILRSNSEVRLSASKRKEIPTIARRVLGSNVNY